MDRRYVFYLNVGVGVPTTRKKQLSKKASVGFGVPDDPGDEIFFKQGFPYGNPCFAKNLHKFP